MKPNFLYCLVIFLLTLCTSSLSAQTPAPYWAKRFAGSSVDYGGMVLKDNHGNTYYTGSFRSTSINISGTILTNADNTNLSCDVFIVRCNANGIPTLVRQIKSSYDDALSGVAVDDDGNIYLAGGFMGSSLTLGSTTLTNSAIMGCELYFAKMDSNGIYIWAKSGDGLGGCSGTAVCVDPEGNAYFCAEFAAPTFTFDGITMTNSGTDGGDPFIVKIDATGHTKWCMNYGGTGHVQSRTIKQDGEGNLYIGGQYYSKSFSIGDTIIYNADSSTSFTDIYLLKIDSAHNFIWAQSAGGKTSEWVSDLCLDDENNLCLVGSFYSPNLSFDSITLTNAWPWETTTDGFLAGFNVDGKCIWGKTIGDIYDETCTGISLGLNGNLAVSGSFCSPILNLDGITLTNSSSENYFSDAYYAAIDSTYLFKWGFRVGGSNSEWGTDIVAEPSGDYSIIGSFGSNTVTIGVINLGNVSPNDFDIFIARIGYNVGIGEMCGISENFLIWPNPTNDQLNISIQDVILFRPDEVFIEISDLQGRMFQRTKVSSTSTSLPVDFLSPGTYVVSILNGEHKKSKVFVKH